VAAGEASGTLDKALDRIATQQEKDAAIVSKIRGAMIYPAIVLLVVLGVLVFMLTTVLPQIGGLFKDLKKTLPLQTRLLLALSSFTTTYWYVVLLFLIGLAFGVRTYIRTVDGRAHLDQLKLKMPLFGKLFHKTYMARFCRTVGTLVGTGVPMLEALSISQQAISNVHIADSIGTAIGKVRGGKSLSSSLEGDSNFMILVPQMIKIGEESGALDEMMGRAAVFYENEVDEEVKNLSTTIEPVLMVVLGLIVAGVILTVLLPVYGLVGGGLQ
jgi:type IV pilus assembly protein PilC